MCKDSSLGEMLPNQFFAGLEHNLKSGRLNIWYFWF